MESLRCSKNNIWIVFKGNDYHHFCKRARSSSKQHLYQIKVIFREVDCFLRISLAHAFTISYVFFMFFWWTGLLTVKKKEYYSIPDNGVFFLVSIFIQFLLSGENFFVLLSLFSMGGHGALICFLKNPGFYKVSFNSFLSWYFFTWTIKALVRVIFKEISGKWVNHKIWNTYKFLGNWNWM